MQKNKLNSINSDIDEYDQTIIDLKLERDGTNNILETVEAMIIALNSKGQITLVNRKACEILGYSEDELLGQDWFFTCISSISDISKMRELFKKVMSGDIANSEYHENAVCTNCGKERLIAWHNSIIYNKNGEIIGSLSAGEDITDRKKAEEKLRKSEEQYRIITTHSPVGIFQTDINGDCIFVNPRWCEITGVSADKVFGQGWGQTMHPDDKQKIFDGWYTAVAAGISWDWECRFMTKQDNITWITGHAEPLFDPLNNIQGYLGIIINITERKQMEESLRESEHLFREMFEQAPLAYQSLNIDGSFLDINQEWLNQLGYERREVIGYLFNNFITTNSNYSFTTQFPRFKDEGSVNGPVFEFKCKNGGIKLMEVNGRISYDNNGNFLRTHCILTNVTEQKKAEKAMRLAASVFTHAREGITITDLNANILDVNNAFTNITGYSREEVIGKNPRILNSKKHDKKFYDAMWKDILNKGYWTGEIWNQHKNGQIVIETLTISSICDENGDIQNYIGLFSDITSIKKQQEYLEHIAHYDMLTHLPNRVLLADRLQYAISQTHRRNNMLAVIFLDLDGFKIVNDEYGHKVGDSLLISLSTRMKNIMRDGDTLARIGGDEFIIVLVDLINIQNSIPIINRLLMSVSEQVVIDGFLLNVTASLGVTFYPQEENLDADQLYRQADQAMYQAKLTGKNRYHIFDEITDRNMRGNNVKIEHIRNALANNEFVLYYQPKVNMRSGVVIGVEALIRWNHPENGILGPVSFLQVIEDHPLATEIGKWVIKTALVQMDIWRSIGLKLPISVNVSAIQLQQLDFVQYLRKLLIEHPDTCSGDLEIEVLETTVLKDIARASVLIEEIRSLGIIFSLDDFGTGYSSLTYLKRLPVKILKIDQSFVYNMLNDADDLSILEGIINLANAFHCTVIAEGVELIEHGEVLLQLGCNLAQGYGIAKPMPGNQIHEWVINWSSPPSWVNCKEISYNNRKILHAIIEHRIWIMNKIDYIKGKNTVLMDMDSKDCVLGKWLNSELLAGHRFTSGYIVINKLHEQVHLLADELCHLRTNGYIEEALTRLNELYNIGDSLIYEMKKMALNN